ncbi:putative LPS assembly protein LptD [Mucilaginibacter aquaedulcis]|uniref:putative LPS assembly protein LptD n=1 Tax=Mucilaginibacter aquaedulcis TaxID=1187081 RepID=UPI0025B50814|nr:putative LPS assembly protein LptD [Mucilaginibacter aquaedulcis]MDN3548318.1 putative LPS assembly protein LptD [Mucilaginibacter aquaedulcis]
MKFTTLFFSLAIILTVSVLVAESKGTHKGYSSKPVADTIIKLDSVRDKKLLKIKKTKSNTSGVAVTDPENTGLNKNYNLIPATDTVIKRDTTKKGNLIKGKKNGAIPVGKNPAAANDTSKNGGIQSEVKAVAEDSTHVDNVKDILYLYGRARVTYEDFELDADYIRVDQKNHVIFASGSVDPRTKRYIGRPISKQKNDKPVSSDSLLFNYETKKGKLYNPASEQDGNFISGGQAKKLNETEVAYRNVIFSTCDLPYPDTHFGIVITRGIGEKNRIISGPAYLEIEGIPLPLAIPFGFFPKPNQRTSGVILPTFGEDQQLGFKLSNFGYYLGFNDYIDLTTTATVYSKGSYELNSVMRYLKRYKYTGNLALSFGSHNYGLPGDPAVKDVHIDWTHSQDPNANPGSTFSASVNAGTSGFFRNTRGTVNVGEIAQSSLRSSISYGKTWAGTPFNLTVGLSHSQDIARKTITLELPTVAFGMSSINPFDSKDRVGEQKWYQKITLSYNMTATNKVNDVPESELFKSETLSKRLQNGFQHQIPVSLGLNVLKYFQFNSSVNYTERWYFQSITKRFERGSIGTGDQLITDTIPGFKRAGEYSLSTGLSTKLYGQINFKKGNLKAIRHVATPSISFGYRPDFSDPGYGYYRTAVSQASIPYPYTSQKYSIFDGAVYGGPSPGKQAGLNFSLDNTIEAKVKAKSTDTSGIDRKVTILQGLSFSTFYNFAADSMKLSPITFSGHTAVFNQKLNISFQGSFNPYVTVIRDSIQNNTIVKYATQINRYTWQDGKFPQLSNLSISMSGSLNSTKAHAPATPGVNTLQNMNASQAQRLALVNSDPNAYVDFNVPWNISFNYSYSYSNFNNVTSTSNTVQISGDVNLTQKWKIQYSTNYDIKAAKLGSATSFSIYRDLHCWDLSVQWIPFGYLKSYNVTLKVKSTILQDLKLSKRNDYTNNGSFY